MALVDYSSSSSSEDEGIPVKRVRPNPDISTASTSPSPSPSTSTKPTPKPKAAAKARRLPPLPSTYAPAPDNPAEHQGRVRTREFVQGDYYAHVYVELPLDTRVRRAVDDMIGAARDSVPGIEVHSLLDLPSSSSSSASSASGSPAPASTATPGPPHKPALHISLTHPLPLRADLARTFATLLATPISAIRPFTVSLAQPKIYHNTARPRRAFAALRVGAGGAGLQSLLKQVEPVLRRQHIEAYFARPEWHASFAWCLDRCEGEEGEDDERGEREGTGGAGDGPETSPYPSTLLDSLESLMPLLREQVWSVDEVCVKVAKRVVRIPLSRV